MQCGVVGATKAGAWVQVQPVKRGWVGVADHPVSASAVYKAIANGAKLAVPPTVVKI